MKAIAIIVIAGGVAGSEIAAAGIILGVIFVVLGIGRFFSIIQRRVPQSVVRGIQFGLALLLLKSSAGFVVQDAGLLITGIFIIGLFFMASRYWKFPDLSSVCAIVVGILAGLLLNGIPPMSFIPTPQPVIPVLSDFSSAFTMLVLPQLVPTVTNAILATSLLAKDLYREEIQPKKLSTTIGPMNLPCLLAVSVPLWCTDRRIGYLRRPDLHRARALLLLS